jgi:hypothetical protein
MADGFENQHSVPYHEYRKVNSAAKRMRQERQRALDELKAAQAQLEEMKGQLVTLARGYKELKEDPRMQMPEDQYEQFNAYQSEQRLSNHLQSFEGALEGLLAEGVTARQILKAVNYAPELVNELTPEILNDVVQTAYSEFPQLFQVVSSQNDQAEPAADDSVPGQMQSAFEQGAVVQQQQRELFQQANTPPPPPQQQRPQGQVPPAPQAARAMPNGMAPQQPAPMPPQFRGYGDLQGRGGPAPTNLPSMSARLRDPAWLAANQGALAQAVAQGAVIQSSDS